MVVTTDVLQKAIDLLEGNKVQHFSLNQRSHFQQHYFLETFGN